MKFFISRFLRSLSSLTTILLIKFISDDEDLGRFIYWITIFFLLTVLVKFNNQVFILKYKEKIEEYFGSFFLIQFSFWILVNVYFFCFFPIKIASAGFLFFTISLFEPWETYFTVVKDYNLTNNVIIKTSLVSILLKISVIFFVQQNLHFYYLFLIALDFSPGFFLFIFYSRNLSIYKDVSQKKIKEVFIYLLPFFFNGLLIYMTGKVDHFLISKFFNFEQLGIYSFAYKLYEGGFIFQMIFGSILISKFSKNLDKLSFKDKDLLFFFRSWLALGALGTVAILCGYYLIDIKSYMAGNEEELFVFIILLPGIVISLIGALMSNISSIHGFSKELFLVNLFNFLVSCCLNYLFLPLYGIYAAAVITLICQFLGSIIFWLFFRNTRKIVLTFFKSLIINKK